jgi:hypothetical protein
MERNQANRKTLKEPDEIFGRDRDLTRRRHTAEGAGVPA